ncbi:MAG: molybdopterin molybdotransferase MoeA [Flavobacteriales bacterium]|nr:molybdopterin molybdotransferase MoeA [Flavobacteriales bacterium]
MITVEKAKRILLEHARTLPANDVTLALCGSRYVVSAVTASYDHPLFDMSAVDGYALGIAGTDNDWKVVGEIAAGDAMAGEIRIGECARIFTGAMVPVGAVAVVMQEFVERNGDRIVHNDQRLRPGSNIRRKGEQAQQGQVILQAGQRISAAAKGLLASVGVTSVPVVPGPKVSVILTGDEFTTGPTPPPGKIFGSNDVMLDALLTHAGAITEFKEVPDDASQLEQAILSGLGSSDMVLSTGGASVGDHDLVRAVVERCGGKVLFHGVAQKPGKPMLFALFGDKPFFGLPGNPRAVIILFWEYVLPFLRAVQGAKDPGPKTELLPIAHDLRVNGDRSEFRAAQVRGGRVTLLRDEGSHMLASLIDADALAYLPAQRREWRTGDPVEVHYLPQ